MRVRVGLLLKTGWNNDNSPQRAHRKDCSHCVAQAKLIGTAMEDSAEMLHAVDTDIASQPSIYGP